MKNQQVVDDSSYQMREFAAYAMPRLAAIIADGLTRDLNEEEATQLCGAYLNILKRNLREKRSGYKELVAEFVESIGYGVDPFPYGIEPMNDEKESEE